LHNHDINTHESVRESKFKSLRKPVLYPHTFDFLGKPDPPTDITLLNATDTSVILSWTPGFDGGV